MKHTPEPWIAYDSFLINAGDNQIVASLESNKSRSAEKRRANRNRIVECVNAMANLNPDAIQGAVKALKRIAAWEMPGSGQAWPNGQDMSYEAAYGSNGCRDFVKQLAAEALAALEVEG